MTRIADKLVCPKCGNAHFLEGPHGGAAINVKCSQCGYWMNVCPLPNGKYWITDELEVKE